MKCNLKGKLNVKIEFTRSGAVFGWGKNMYGQLGLQDVEDRYYPTHLKTLRNVKVNKFYFKLKILRMYLF